MEEKFSLGFNTGYLFGKKDYSSRRSLINDSVSYYQANFQTKSTFGRLQASAGLQYQIPLNKSMTLTLGAYGNLGQEINAEQDVLRETFYYDQGQGEVRLDSVSDVRGRKGTLILPASYTFGFVKKCRSVISPKFCPPCKILTSEPRPSAVWGKK